MLLSVAGNRAQVFVRRGCVPYRSTTGDGRMIQGQLSLPLRLLVGSHEPRRQHDDESDASSSRAHLSANGWSSCRVPPFPLSARRQSKALVDGGSDLVFDSISVTAGISIRWNGPVKEIGATHKHQRSHELLEGARRQSRPVVDRDVPVSSRFRCRRVEWRSDCSVWLSHAKLVWYGRGSVSARADA